MKFTVKHETRGRMRVHLAQQRMSSAQADLLAAYLESCQNVSSVKVRERTQDAVICYRGERAQILQLLRTFCYETADVPDKLMQNSSRKLNNTYWEKLVTRVLLRFGSKLILPTRVREVITAVQSVKYIWNGIRTLAKGRIEVPVLDATAIGVSIWQGNYNTASSVMFLLGIGEILEEWTHKKSVDDLARSMSLQVEKVWLLSGTQQVLVDTQQVRTGDKIVVHMGNVIPFDGNVVDGEGLVNQASLTGEPLPVRKARGITVYAGTVVEEGEVTIQVTQTGGTSKYEKIVTMIEESEKLKSNLESKAEHLADRLVPYTFLGTGLVYLATRNITKAISVLMVDYSCALKLAMPISVLSAIREASQHSITVKGGKYMEALSEAQTVVFDKTGTLTKAQPTVVDVVPFGQNNADEMLRIAACLEEHFPHSMAKAVVDAAERKGLTHEEMHTKVEYIVAHGIATTIDGKRAIIGSNHFVFEDEECMIPQGEQDKFDRLPRDCSHLYLAIEKRLSAVLCIEDPLREEARDAIRKLKETGIEKIVMMTGDSERTARVIAKRVGVDEYFAEVLPEDKAGFVEGEKQQGRKVIMIGDGINDSPALSAADVGIAISDGAQIAREIADVTVGAEDLYELVTLKRLSNGLMKRIHNNYRSIIGINTSLIALGVLGILPPTTSALLHNASTLFIGVKSMNNILD